MKKKILFALGSTVFYLSFMVVSFDNTLKARPEGVSGHSGKTLSCDASNCHSGVNKRVTNAGNAVLTSDIPASGYVPGTMYNMTLTIKSKKSRVGFNLRPENTSGALAGTLSSVTNCLVTTAAGTLETGQIAGELTHTSSTTISGGKKVITFKWVAPVKGTGTVTYYGAVGTGINKDDVNDALDTLNNFSVIINEVSTVSDVNDVILESENFVIYPTIVNNELTIEHVVKNNEEIDLQIVDSKGSSIKNVFSGKTSSGLFRKSISCSELKSGIYYLRSTLNGKTVLKKFIVEN